MVIYFTNIEMFVIFIIMIIIFITMNFIFILEKIIRIIMIIAINMINIFISNVIIISLYYGDLGKILNIKSLLFEIINIYI